MDKKNSKKDKERQQDFYKVLLPEVPLENINNFVGIKEKYSSMKKKYALNLPDVDSKDSPNIPSPTNSPKQDVDSKSNIPLDLPPVEVGKTDIGGGTLAPIDSFGSQDDDSIDKETLSVLLDIEDLKHSLTNLKTELRINDTKEDIKFEVDQMIKSVRKEVEDLKARKVPVRKEFDTEGAYKEQLYPQVVNIMDELLLPLISSIPDYNLLATQVSSTYDDGTIKNAIVSILVTIINNDYKYEFKVDVPILNGLIQSPQYMTRSRKIIPLTEEALYAELNSESFIKISPDFRKKDNMFSNVGENMLRQHDNQKLYPTTAHPQRSEISGDRVWLPNKQRTNIDE